eukprot:Skav210125  [mRNA]  locus=scaffold2194:318535:320046:+ [translate_table: standard]
MAGVAVVEATKKAESDKASRIVISSDGKKIVKAPDPYPSSKAIPLRALEEDDYVEAVSALIERDFFPDLPHLRARYELMQARLRGDNALAKALEKKLRCELPRPTPGATPRPAEPEAIGRGAGGAAAARLSAWERDDGSESVASANAGSIANYEQVLLRLVSGREVLVDLSTVRLDDFQKAFTSEDNASFEAVLEKDRERRRQKEWWVEGSEEKHNTKCEALKDQIRESQSTGEIMTCEFQARNTFYFKPRGEMAELIEKPTVESRNTRFTTQEQSELDETLIAAVAARQARESGQQFSEVLAKMVKDGTFSITALHSHGNVRAVGGRLETAMGHGPSSYPMVNTPALLPGENGFSPLMTFGRIASTPKALDEDAGPTFSVQPESARDRAAEKLAKGAMQKQRESRQNSKKERLKALGLTPSASPASTRPTPASVASKVTPMTPIGQLLHRAQKMAQRGGRLRIASSQRPTPTPTDVPSRKRQRTSKASPVSAIPVSMMADLL